jgi:HK97 family phage prohead protease
MPYFITEEAEGCSGWATIKDDGEVLGCHTTKQDAIDQMVALSIAEDMEPGGERSLRARPDELEVGDFVSWRASGGRARGKITRIRSDGEITAPESDFTITGTPDDPAALIRIYEQTQDGWRETPVLVVHRFTTLTKIDELRSEQRDLPDNYRPALAEDVPEGRACGNCFFFNEERQNEEGTKAWCEKWEDFVDGGYYCNGWEAKDEGTRKMKTLANSLIARIDTEERTMTDTIEKTSRWADVARAIQKKIDGDIPNNEPEIRTNSTEFEIRSEGEDGMTFTGYASVFNSSSEDLGGFREFVAPGAFKRSLQARNEIKLLWNHDTSEPLASLRNGSLELTEDRYGLKVKARLPKTTRGKDVAELLRSKVIDSMSFGFNVIKDSWSENGSVRTLESVRLSEVSIVTYPAYTATTAQVRSIAPSIDADELANALLKLESGEDLDEKSASLITDVVGKLRQQPESEVETGDNGLALLDLKKKQLDLLLKRI